MAAYSSVLSRKEQVEEREMLTRQMCALFPACIFLSGPAGLS